MVMTWLWLLLAPSVSAQSGAGVEGAVVNSVTRAGIPGVRVALKGAGRSNYQTTTDAAGHFAIADAVPGRYLATFYHDRFADPQSDSAAEARALPIRNPIALPRRGCWFRPRVRRRGCVSN
ncbi:exported hypothetical protein [Candidatus Sulfopaludibacter sp. SbA3]|nr:exported hypothetical protein [Candidatus Sulfopaludibacter sp. SbA3]